MSANVMLDVRYGNRRIELKPGKPTIEVGSTDNLLPTLKAVKETVAAGELDKLLMAAKKERVHPGIQIQNHSVNRTAVLTATN